MITTKKFIKVLGLVLIYILLSSALLSLALPKNNMQNNGENDSVSSAVKVERYSAEFDNQESHVLLTSLKATTNCKVKRVYVKYTDGKEIDLNFILAKDKKYYYVESLEDRRLLNASTNKIEENLEIWLTFSDGREILLHTEFVSLKAINESVNFPYGDWLKPVV